MLVGGDLGFWSRVVVVAFVVLIGPVLAFLARLKGRREAAAGKEEVEQHLVAAPEEEARAELESSAGYVRGYGGYHEVYGNGYGHGYGYDFRAEVEDQLLPTQLGPSGAVAVAAEVPGPVTNQQNMMYPCAVCSRLTKARCKQCKAVHYCSGKCQIIHWRLGHKNECRPYSVADQKSDLGVTSHLKVSNEEENRTYGYGIQSEGTHSSNSVETSFAEPAFSNSGSPLVHDGKNDIELEHFVDEKGRHPASEFTSNSINDSSAHISMNGLYFDVSHGFDGSGRHLSDNHDVEENQTSYADMKHAKPSVSELPMSVRSVDSNDTTSKISQMKLSIGVADNSCIPPASSLGIYGAVKSSLCEPSTSSSGFWEGKLVQNRSRIDAPDDISHSCSSEADENNGLDSQCSSSESPTSAMPHVDTSNGKTVELDDSQPITSDIGKATDGDTLSIDEGEGYLGTRKSPSLIPETINYIGGSGSGTKTISKPGELVPPASGAGEKLMTEEILKASGFSSLSAGTSNYGVESRISSSHELESRNIESNSFKASEAPLSSNSGGVAVGSVKAVKSGSAQGTAACSLELGGHQPNDKNVLRTSGLGVVHQLKASMSTRQNTLGGSSGIVTRYMGIFPYEMFVKLYNWKNFGFRPSGLVNCGNSCYANAVLQCLAFTPPLTAYFLQGLHSKSCEKKEWCFTCEFEGLLLKAQEGISPLSPVQIISHLQDIGSHLSNGREEDAHEFLRCAIDAMQSICLKEAGITESGSPEEVTTLIGLTFGGYLRSKIECLRCGGKSVRHERMMDITVEIDGDIGTLEEALRQFTRSEILDGDNGYRCGWCKSYEKARKKLTVVEAPNILSIVLKRFQSGALGKLNKAIKFPDILNLAPYMSGTSDKSPIYRLYGVVVHLDIMNAAFSGHYMSYVKNIENKWFEVDDRMVKEVELERVLTKGAYMLLYARCSPRAPRLIRSSLVPRDPRKLHHKPRSFLKGLQGGSVGNYSNGQPCPECKRLSHASFPLSGTISEDDCSSDHSPFFSDDGSYSTDTSNRDSTSFDDPLDHMPSEMGVGWHSPWTNSSDSETSSCSSSPSPLFPKQSPLANSYHYATGCPKSGGSCMHNAIPVSDSHRPRARSVSSNNLQVLDSNKNIHISCPNSTKQLRNLISSSSTRETNCDRLGRINPFDGTKSGISLRRSASERTGVIIL